MVTIVSPLYVPLSVWLEVFNFLDHFREPACCFINFHYLFIFSYTDVCLTVILSLFHYFSFILLFFFQFLEVGVQMTDLRLPSFLMQPFSAINFLLHTVLASSHKFYMLYFHLHLVQCIISLRYSIQLMDYLKVLFCFCVL